MKSGKKVLGSLALVGALALGSGVGAYASEAGFLTKFKEALFGMNTQVAQQASNSVTKGSTEQELNNHINAESKRITDALTSEYAKKVKEGKDNVEAHKEYLKQQISNTATQVIDDGKTKIDKKVDEKSDTLNKELDAAVEGKISADLKKAGIPVNESK